MGATDTSANDSPKDSSHHDFSHKSSTVTSEIEICLHRVQRLRGNPSLSPQKYILGYLYLATLFTVNHPNISYSAKIWQAIYLAKCPNLAFGKFCIRRIAMPIYNYYDAIADNCLNGRWYRYVRKLIAAFVAIMLTVQYGHTPSANTSTVSGRQPMQRALMQRQQCL